jgi:hypothetical protein
LELYSAMNDQRKIADSLWLRRNFKIDEEDKNKVEWTLRASSRAILVCSST